MAESSDWVCRWSSIEKLLLRNGADALNHPDFVPGPKNIETLNSCKLLVVGAGGLGCELLKDLALMGFQNLHLIDMDTIDVSNLNRQFLFRKADVGRSKAEVAAEFINRRIPGCHVTAHFCKIQDKDDEFYRSFQIVVCGLDSVAARRWMNGMLCDLLQFDDDGDVDFGSIIPFIDGGTEGFKGSARVIYPGLTPCIECTLGLYPPQVDFPLCTIAHTPRLPEHCIEYAKILQWPKEKPFGDEPLDGDNPEHIQWILEQALIRAADYGIEGVTYRLTQGVIKHIIPAVASTNAVVAAACALEAFKCAISCSLPMNNYMNFQDTDGVYAGTVSLEKKEDCPVCSRRPQHASFSDEAKLRDVINYLIHSVDYQMKNPSIYFGSTSLYVSSITTLEEATRPNLSKMLKELDLVDGSTIMVADQTLPRTMEFVISLSTSMV